MADTMVRERPRVSGGAAARQTDAARIITPTISAVEARKPAAALVKDGWAETGAALLDMA